MVCEEFKNRFPYDIDKYSIVYFVFDRILRDDLLEMLHCLKNNRGLSYDGIGYYLPSIFESKDEEGYFDDGVMLYLDDNEEQKIDFTMFMECIRVACEVYVKEHPLKADEIEALLRFFENDPTSPLITNKKTRV